MQNPVLSPTVVVDSSSVGDPARFLTEEQLEQRLSSLPGSPAQHGRLMVLMRRGEGGLRERLTQVRLDPVLGVPGDAWGRKPSPKLHSQVTAMQLDVAECVANGQPLELFGDNLFVQLDLSSTNLPPFSLIQIGSALLEVTEKPHTGCSKFEARFGLSARRFTRQPELQNRNLRGIHLRVVESGDVVVGSLVTVIRRGS